MFEDVVVAAVICAALALIAWLVWGAWHQRRADFIYRVPLGWQADATTAAFFDRVIPVLVRDGFTAAASGGHTTVFERRFMPAWTVLVAIFLFPIGLLALLSRGRESVTIVATSQALEVQGYCTKPMADFIIAVAGDGANHVSQFR